MSEYVYWYMQEQLEDVHKPFLTLRMDVYFEPEREGGKHLVSTKAHVTGRTPMVLQNFTRGSKLRNALLI
jgi:hypothetical protein